jgi:hypothetical protein
MKNLFKINEEERSRILNLHEGMANKQYLNEELPGTENSVNLGGDIDNAIADPAKKAERIKNISRIVCSLKGDKINNKNSKLNGKSWVDYVTTYNITSTEEAQARKLCSTGGDERLYNIAKVACSVDASGKIVAPNSKLNGKMFTDYIRTYKLTGAEVEKAKQLCGKLGNKPAASTTATAGKVGGKSATSTIAPRVKAIQQKLGIQNGTGTMDAATLQSLIAKLNSGTQPVSSLTPAGVAEVGNTQPQGMSADQLNATINQLSANANRPV